MKSWVRKMSMIGKQRVREKEIEKKQKTEKLGKESERGTWGEEIGPEKKRKKMNMKRERERERERESRRQLSLNTHRSDLTILMWNIPTFLLRCRRVENVPGYIIFRTPSQFSWSYILQPAVYTLLMDKPPSSMPSTQFLWHSGWGIWVHLILGTRCISCYFLLPVSDFLLVCHPHNLKRVPNSISNSMCARVCVCEWEWEREREREREIEIGFYKRKEKLRPAIPHKQKEIMLKWI